MLMHLDYLQYQDVLKLRKTDGRGQVWDVVRRKYVAWTPEEMVRQLLVHYLEAQDYSLARMRVEGGITAHNRERRFDLLVYTAEVLPFLLCECKAPKVSLDEKTIDQARLYNDVLHVPYFLVTNGMETLVAEVDYQQRKLNFLTGLPKYPL